MEILKALLRTTLEGACQSIGGELAKTTLSWLEKKTGKVLMIKEEPAATKEDSAARDSSYNVLTKEEREEIYYV